jgi:hypothetical protein
MPEVNTLSSKSEGTVSIPPTTLSLLHTLDFTSMPVAFFARVTALSYLPWETCVSLQQDVR